jgi:hypothetical protein
MTIRLVLLVLLIAFAGYRDPALAEDECKDILSAALLTRTLKSSASQSDRALNMWACSSNYDAVSKVVRQAEQRSGGGSLGVNILGVHFGGSGGGGGSSSNENAAFEQAQAEHCNQADFAGGDASFEFYAQQHLPQEVIASWASCMADRAGRDKLACYASPHSGDNITFTYVWRSEDNLPVIDRFEALAAGHRETIKPAGETLKVGSETIPVPRDPSQDVDIYLNAILNEHKANTSDIHIPKEQSQ